MAETFLNKSWQEFELFVSQILELSGFEKRSNEKIQARQTDIWVTAGSPLISSRIIVECKFTKRNSSLPLDYVTEFCNRVALARTSGVAEHGWLVTNHRVPQNAWEVIRSSHLDIACRILHPKELLYSLVNLPKYIYQLRLSFPATPTGFVDPDVSILTEVRKRYPFHASFVQLLNLWLADSGRPILFLLGDYGQGKSTCVEEIVRTFQHDNVVWGGRIPLFIRLRDVANQGYALASMIRVCLQEHFGLNYYSFELLDYLAHSGCFLFIFDGLDEVTYSLRWSEVYDSLKQIYKLGYKENKIIITSRPGVFPSLAKDAIAKLDRILPGHSNVAYAGTKHVIAYLEYFNEKQIKAVMSNYGISEIDATSNTLAKIHDLTDLTKRPITLRMILESLEQLEQIQGPADLYEMYSAHWLSRDAWRSNIEMISIEQGRELKREIVEYLAWTMFEHENYQVEAAFIRDVISKYCSDLKLITDVIETFLKEIMVCSFLDFRRDRTLAFSHRSFYEYFLARHLSSLPYAELLNRLSRFTFEPEVLLFLVQMVDWRMFINNEQIHGRLTTDRVLAGNILQASGDYGFPISFDVALRNNSNVSCHSSEPILLNVVDSIPQSLKVISDSDVYLSVQACRIDNSIIGAPKSIDLRLQGSVLERLDISGTSRLNLFLADSSIKGGAIQNFEECRLTLSGIVSLNGLAFDSFDRVMVVHDGQVLEKSKKDELLKSVGLRVENEPGSSQKRSKRRHRHSIRNFEPGDEPGQVTFLE